MSPWLELLLLAGTALLAGALNAVAGGGSFFTVPALILVGVDPVVANATSTVALWPGTLASAWAYRREVAAVRHELRVLGGVCAVGGVAGALLLVRTPGEFFLRLLPLLLLVATLLFTFGPRVHQALGLHASGQGARRAALGVFALIAIYGGYFGGGMGLMVLAGLTLRGLSNIHEMNGLKVVLGALVNGLAVGTFLLAGVVEGRLAAAMVAGAVVGGLAGAGLARRVEARSVRRFVVLAGWSMTAWFFARAWLG